MDEYLPAAAPLSPGDDVTYAARAVDTPSSSQRRMLPIVLFLLTCASTYYTGCIWSGGALDFGFTASDVWRNGLAYMAAVMAILTAHEMGHFLQARRHGVPASWPYFIPMPMSPVGTMGAVIGMQGSQADRRQLFDIGISGPLAGLVVAVPLAWYGIRIAEVDPSPPVDGLELLDPLLFQWLIEHLRPELGPNPVFRWNPYYMAAWVGMLITGLNMMPVSQLDGGHVAYSLFGSWAHRLARLVIVGAMVGVGLSGEYGWSVMIALVLYLGVDHPPTLDDRVPLGIVRSAIGYASLAIPILCLAPIPLREITGR